MQEKWENFLDWIWYDRVRWIRSKYEMFCRMFYWGWHMRYSWDFDAHTIYEMLYRKLDKLYDTMLNHSHLMWNSDPNNNLMRKLLEAKGLAYRLWQYRYDTQAFVEADKKFKYKSWTTPCENDCYRYHSTWEKNPETAKLFIKARRKHYQQMEQDDRNRLYYLLNKYTHYWWD